MLSSLDLMYHSINLQHIAYAGADVYAWMLIHCSASNVSNLKPPGLSKVVHVAADFVACVAIQCPPGDAGLSLDAELSSIGISN